MSGATIKKPGVTIQKTYEDAELFLSDRNDVNVGNRIRVPAFKVPAAVIDGKRKMNFNEINVDGEYATVYYKDKTSLYRSSICRMTSAVYGKRKGQSGRNQTGLYLNTRLNGCSQ